MGGIGVVFLASLWRRHGISADNPSDNRGGKP
jgi:hypothetical protein